MRKPSTSLGILVTLGALVCWLAPAAVRAGTNPSAVLITVRCGVSGAASPADASCDLDIPPKAKTSQQIDGTVEILSGGVVVASETSPMFFLLKDGQNFGTFNFLATGNGNQALFNAWYGDAASSVLNAPDVTVKVWKNVKGGRTLLINQKYAPSGSALWSLHSEDAIAETARAKAAEAALQAAINNQGTGDAAAIAAETARAKAAESGLQNQIASEIAARQAADNVLTNALAKEILDRFNADGALQGSINVGLANAQAALSAETTRAQVAEGAEATRAKAAEAALQTAINDEAAARKQGDADTLAAAKVYADGKVAIETAARLSADSTLTTGLNSEIARATAAEANLKAALEAEIIRAQTAEFNIRTDVNTEVARATAAEAALQAAINAAANNNAALQAAITAETNRATAAENLLAANLAAETARALAAETALSASITAETARATAAEAGKANIALDNLAAVAINASLVAGAAATLDLGTGDKGWRTLYLASSGTAGAGIDFEASGGGAGKQTLLQATPATGARTIKLPDASGTVAVSASGNVALDANGNITFAGTLPVQSGGTNNTTFSNNKFVAFDGTKLASTGFDSSSFASSNASLSVLTGAGLAGGGSVALGGSVTLSIPPLGVTNAMLQNPGVTITAGVGMAGGGPVALGGSITLNNAGVTGLSGGGGVTVDAGTGAITLGTAGGGDVSGALSSLTVGRIQNRAISPAAPAAGQVLTWDGVQWSPAAPPGGGGNLNGVGAAQTLAVWTGGAALGNSSISDDGAGTVNIGSGTFKMMGRTALSDSADGWLRFNQAGTYASGIYTPGFLRADGGFTSGPSGSLGPGTMLATAQMQTPALYDYNDTSYFVDPNSTSRLQNVRFNTADCLNGFCPPNGAVRFTPNMHLNANNGNAVIINWDNGSLPGNNTQQLRIGNGQGGDAFYFTSAGYGVGSYINTSDNQVGSGVTGVMVKQGDNYHRTGNSSAVANFVNKACGNSNAGLSCTSYENLGNAGWGYAATFTGSLPSGGSNEHWYRATFTTSGGGNTGSYRPHVYLNGGQAYYTIDVFDDDCATKLSCGEGGGMVSMALDNWEVIQEDVGVGDLSNASGTLTVPPPGAGGAVRIRVRPYTDAAGAGCPSYSLVVRNDGN